MSPLPLPLQTLPFGLTVSNALQILLSALLAGLYYFMYQTQQRQANIQETQNQIISWQTRLMAAEHQPELVAEDIFANGNIISLEISNVGEGRARDLKLSCRLYHKEGKNYLPAFGMKALGFVITPTKTPLNRVQQAEVANLSSVVSTSANTSSSAFEDGIDAREEGVLFESKLKQNIKTLSPVMDVSFTRAVEQMMEEWDVEKIGYDLHITYRDVVEQEHTLRIESRSEIDVEKGIEFESVLKKGKELDKPVMTLVPESSTPSKM